MYDKENCTCRALLLQPWLLSMVTKEGMRQPHWRIQPGVPRVFLTQHAHDSTVALSNTPLVQPHACNTQLLLPMHVSQPCSMQHRVRTATPTAWGRSAML